jgi:hypothetical protein
MMFKKLVPIAAIALIFTACGSGAKNPVTPPPSPTPPGSTPGNGVITVNVSPTSATIVAGGPQSGPITVKITRGTGVTGVVECALIGRAGTGDTVPNGVLDKWTPSALIAANDSSATMYLVADTSSSVGNIRASVFCTNTLAKGSADFDLKVD